MKRFSKLLMLAAALTLVAAACGSDDDSGSATTAGGEDLGLISAGKLTVCSEIPYEPFEFEEGGGYVGFDVDIVQAVADQIGVSMEFISTGFDAITSGSAFAANQCDMAASAITITPEREQAINFSDPYFDADQSLLVKSDSGITTLDDLVGKNLGVQSGTTGEAYAQDNAPDGVNIVSFENGGELFVALEAGSIDGILQDLPVNGYRSVKDDTVEVVQTYTTGEQYGLAMAKGKDALLSSVDSALSTMRSDGQYDEVYSKWFGGS